ncbi:MULTISPECIES: flavodoxin family protein [Desulfococcus]|uniref:NADPH-dependent FMN reductase n=1 Tax=Desulfococcus multivorans DSM 2059 TaxID=1121405 RepID=S7TPM4_DESML|nr:flavodoxin family protein [Desulfococcus multivorans]AOY57796.1 NADPH-dependent FMN reductase [Desulfococcus multivorans]AQV00181.1 NADPH-dependent FMN reductase [Desulfococcus multivorans]EPR38881.1 NADPH-dependent FMN reductase [Desulfococcus multivorans DSM 2059]SJZ68140.1 NADPH-dependent FMN reductase [Desulfococcus multivorans DSM 2059]
MRIRILGISGSPRKEKVSGTYKLVSTVLENTGLDYDLISLRGKTIGGCIACLGCAPDNVCKVKDDLESLREEIVAADAYVIGAPNYYSTLNAGTHAFLERWFQFRHQAGNLLWGKLAVAVGVGGMDGRFPAENIEKFFMYNFIETVAKVSGQGAASCYSCGYGETCKVGVPSMLYGENVKITPEMIPDVSKDPILMQAAADAGKLLGYRLKNDHDRKAVTRKMQRQMMQMMKTSA